MKTEKYSITGMSCAACSSAVEKATRKLKGVETSEVNLTTAIMLITYDENKVTSENIMDTVIKVGFEIKREIPVEQVSTNIEGSDNKRSEIENIKQVKTQDKERKKVITSVIIMMILLYISMGQMLIENIPLPDIININTHPVNFAMTQLLLTLPILYLGRKFLINGFRMLYHRNPNMDSLVAIGSTCSFVYSLVVTYMITDNVHQVHQLYYESAAVIITLIMVGKYLEHNNLEKTKGAIQKLMELAPNTANLVHCANCTEYKEIETSQLEKGNIVLVKAGDKIPLDGIVIKGSSAVDESMLTGESIPIDKEVGMEVIGGSINQTGILYVEITRVGGDTTLSKIIQFVEDAQGKKAPISKIADKVAGIFVPTVMVVAIVAGSIWLLLGYDISFALRIFTSVLVIACPCALGLATPTAIMVGTGLGASHGILIRNGEALEMTHKTQVVVLDKTGTITEGKPKVVKIISHTMEEEAFMKVTCLVEAVSEHPLAKAIVAYGKEEKIQIEQTIVTYETLLGKGIKASLDNQQNVIIGNQRILEEYKIDSKAYEKEINLYAQRGQTPIGVAIDGVMCGIVIVADSIKETSKVAIKQLQEMGMKVVMLTGDNKQTAEYIGGEVGVDQVVAEVLPEEKAKVIQEYQDRGNTVLMVGDGINDAPALTQANIGCAIGSGSDIAIESADVVLMKNDLRDVYKAIELSKITLRHIKQNLFWAFCYNIIGIPIAAGGLYLINGVLLTPMIAGFTMSISSLCVVLNALRIKRKTL